LASSSETTALFAWQEIRVKQDRNPTTKNDDFILERLDAREKTASYNRSTSKPEFLLQIMDIFFVQNQVTTPDKFWL